MSTEIVVRFYFEQDAPPADEVLCRMAQAVAAWPQASGEMHGLKVFQKNRHKVLLHRENRFSAGELCAVAAGHGGPDTLVSTTTSFRCWRVAGGRSQPGSVGAWLEAWGEAWGRAHHE